MTNVYGRTPEEIEANKTKEDERRQAAFEEEYQPWLAAVTQRNALLAAGRPSLAAQIDIPPRPQNWEPVPR